MSSADVLTGPPGAFQRRGTQGSRDPFGRMDGPPRPPPLRSAIELQRMGRCPCLELAERPCLFAGSRQGDALSRIAFDGRKHGP
jgi:hypothetical protein